MAKKRTMNEYRQTKEHYISPAKQIIAQLEDQEAIKQMAEIDKQEVDSSTDIEAIKSMIVDKITRHFRDILFETVCEEMMDHPVFQSMTYLTEEGYDQFEDEWFEFYHEHHGDILHEVTQNITN